MLDSTSTPTTTTRNTKSTTSTITTSLWCKRPEKYRPASQHRQGDDAVFRQSPNTTATITLVLL